MDIYELIIANFIGFTFALFLYGINQWRLSIKENNEKKEKQINFLTLIKKEIIFNFELTEIFSKKDFGKVFPTGRLRVENQRGCWTKVVEYRHKNIDLLNDINMLYSMFETLNKLLDLIPSYFSDLQDTTPYMKIIEDRFKELSNKCTEIGKDILNDIEKELKKSKL